MCSSGCVCVCMICGECAGAKNHSVFIRPNKPMHFHAKPFVNHLVHNSHPSVSLPKSTTCRLVFFICVFFRNAHPRIDPSTFNGLATYVCGLHYGRRVCLAYFVKKHALRSPPHRIRSMILCLCDKFLYKCDQSHVAIQMW